MDIDGSSIVSLNDTLTEHVHICQDVDFEVQAVARLLYEVGLTKLAGRLDCVLPLVESAREVQTAYVRDVEGQINHGQQMVSGMLSVALKGGLSSSKRPPATGGE